ncbi:MAG TPA: DUF4282 domain-containing protein [Acidimicrobiales bacterium]|nr:DUF4282 domain-containing protein [Acidimicrobiales bacterium]
MVPPGVRFQAEAVVACAASCHNPGTWRARGRDGRARRSTSGRLAWNRCRPTRRRGFSSPSSIFSSQSHHDQDHPLRLPADRHPVHGRRGHVLHPRTGQRDRHRRSQALVVIPLAYLVYLILTRIWMEILIVVFRIGDDIHAIRQAGGLGGPGAGATGGPTYPA